MFLLKPWPRVSRKHEAAQKYIISASGKTFINEIFTGEAGILLSTFP